MSSRSEPDFGTAGVVGGVRKSRPRTQPLIPQKFDTIVSFNLLPDHPELGIDGSKKEFRSYLAESFPEVTVGESDESDFYLRIVATAVEIDQISTHKSVKMIWPNNAVSGHLVTSVETVRASACWRTFEARGDGITWAVLDTGINEKHTHFVTHATVDPNLSKSFVAGNALSDPDGHGTHVARELLQGRCRQAIRPIRIGCRRCWAITLHRSRFRWTSRHRDWLRWRS